jgi:mannosyltransferase OCH1-like enzyme|tara:strand:+ start:222 stop:521 length:300 start_codon:yes stop_codon:yes gene_type:complete
MRRKLDDNQIFHWHEPTKEMAIEHIQNIQPLIDSNKKLQQEDHHIKDEFRLSARIPMTVYYEWKNKYGVDLFNPNHKEGVRKLINSPEYRYLKTTNRRI